MGELILATGIFLGSLQITAYRPVREQTDDTPCIPANGKFVHSDGVAVSRDLHERWGGPLKFGDMVYIEGVGYKIVTDVMNKRHKKAIDVFVWTEAEEAKFWSKWKGKRTTAYKMGRILREKQRSTSRGKK